MNRIKIEQGQWWDCVSEDLVVEVLEYEELLKAHHISYYDKNLGTYLFSGFVDKYGHTLCKGRVDLDLLDIVAEETLPFFSEEVCEATERGTLT